MEETQQHILKLQGLCGKVSFNTLVRQTDFLFLFECSKAPSHVMFDPHVIGHESTLLSGLFASQTKQIIQKRVGYLDAGVRDTRWQKAEQHGGSHCSHPWETFKTLIEV